MATTEHVWGANSYEWFLLSDWMGLGADLLPVVCRPDAEVSPNSNLKDYRKTPSMYNADGKVVGIHQWTKHEATVSDIEAWSHESDYGICIIGRHIKAIDIDVEDEAVSEMIRIELMKGLGITDAPYRFRTGTGKCLVPVRCDELVLKDSFDCGAGGIVELLGDRQQFVASGTHKSGTRYQWSCSAVDMPTVTREQLDDAWQRLKLLFAVDGKSRRSNVTERSVGEHVAMDDALADYIVDNGLVVAERRDGGYDVACPWVNEHSDGGADGGLAAFWPAGKNGVLRSGFCCLHAHCAGRNSNDYAKAIGFDEAQFEVVEQESTELDVLGGIDRDKNGLAHANLPNLSVILSRPQLTGYHIAKDLFLDDIVAHSACVAGEPKWVKMSDELAVRIRRDLERGAHGVKTKPISRDLMRDSIMLTADDNKFDSAMDWGNGLKWDGVSRVESFLPELFGTDDTPYTRAVGMYMWTALAARLLVPGEKADMAPIFVGPQGFGKSTGLSAMTPDGLYGTVDMSLSDDTITRATRGKLVVELEELNGMSKRDNDNLKAWLSRKVDEHVPKYREFAVRSPRRFIAFGTTNVEEFLRDETGNRRYLPVAVTRKVEVKKIERLHEQLWAEAIQLFKENGVAYEIAASLALAEHDKYMVRDSWEDAVADWLDTLDADGIRYSERGRLSIKEVLVDALHFTEKQIKRADEIRAGVVLGRLGWTRKRVRIGGERAYRYERG